jgi:hypothetical protein
MLLNIGWSCFVPQKNANTKTDMIYVKEIKRKTIVMLPFNVSLWKKWFDHYVEQNLK